MTPRVKRVEGFLGDHFIDRDLLARNIVLTFAEAYSLTRVESMFVIVWEYGVKTSRLKEFEEAYGATGIWVKFFKQGDGYIETELHKDINAPRKFITIDYWDSHESYEQFRTKYFTEYEDIDQQCQGLTDYESCLGYFRNRIPKK